ncbi:MAG: Deaminase [Pseudomonadota bacterium]|nr:Deaminase [Pseudomonadota bacterium]
MTDDPVAIDRETGWALLLEVRRIWHALETWPARLEIGLNHVAPLLEIASDGSWAAQIPVTEAGAELLDLYLPLALACRTQPFTVAHLGQSLDGRIATVNGASCPINSSENLTHLHRMRALCDAIVVGANTVECDNPQLTTRRVAGPHPVRVVLDPRRRLSPEHRLFHDGMAPTVLVCAEALANQSGPGQVQVIGVPGDGQRLSLVEVLRQLHERGLFGLFIEGGGLTVSAFLQAGLLDRLQITIAPLIIGSGRPGMTLPVIEDLSLGLRPPCRRYGMGQDVLFDCRLRD